MEASNLKRPTTVDPKAADLALQSVRAATAIDTALAKMAKDSAPTFSALQRNLVAQTAKTLNGFDTTKLVDALGMRRMTETLAQVFPSGVATSRITAALAGYKLPVASSSLIEALRGVDYRPVFGFAKTLEDLGPAVDMQQMAKAFGELDLPRPFTASIGDALARLPSAAITGLVPTTEAALAETATLAGSTAVAKVAEEAFVEIEGMTTAERRDLARDVLTAITAFVSLVALLTKDRRLELVTVLLPLVAVLVSVYWRLDGKAAD